MTAAIVKGYVIAAASLKNNDRLFQKGSGKRGTVLDFTGPRCRVPTVVEKPLVRTSHPIILLMIYIPAAPNCSASIGLAGVAMTHRP